MAKRKQLRGWRSCLCWGRGGIRVEGVSDESPENAEGDIINAVMADVG